jgi:predicted transcriptional regulator
MNKDMYKKRFGELYQTNIARLENYNTYTNIPVQEPTKDYEGNQKYLDDLKAAYKDSETNIQQFVDSLKDVKTDDKEVQDMNDKLVKQGENLLADIKTKIQKLDDVPADLLNKPEVEFKQGINDLVTDTDNNKNGTDTMDTDFNKMLKDMRNTLGIK